MPADQGDAREGLRAARTLGTNDGLNMQAREEGDFGEDLLRGESMKSTGEAGSQSATAAEGQSGGSFPLFSRI